MDNDQSFVLGTPRSPSRQVVRRMLFQALFGASRDPQAPVYGSERRVRRREARKHAKRFFRENREKLRG